MSAIPPNSIASILQTTGGVQRAAAAKDADQRSQTDAVKGEFQRELTQAIDGADADQNVYADAEGTGSQGRPFDGDDEAGRENENAADVPKDADGHIDLSA